MTDPLSIARFEAIVAAYGADQRRWPDDERERALALLRTSYRAGMLLEAAGDTDALLARHVVPGPSAALRDAVCAAIPGRSRLGRIGPWWAALALALAGSGGVLAGTTAAMIVAPDRGALPIWDRGEVTAFGDLLAEDA